MPAAPIKTVENWDSTSKTCITTYYCFSNMQWLIKDGEKIPFDEAGSVKMSDLPTFPNVGGDSPSGPWSLGLSKIIISQLASLKKNGHGYVSVDLDTSLNLAQFTRELASILKISDTTLLMVANKLESKLDFTNVTLEV